MDILISSNLERLISVLSDPKTTASLMEELKEKGKYTASAALMEKIRSLFSAYSMNETETKQTIAD